MSNTLPLPPESPQDHPKLNALPKLTSVHNKSMLSKVDRLPFFGAIIATSAIWLAAHHDFDTPHTGFENVIPAPFDHDNDSFDPQLDLDNNTWHPPMPLRIDYSPPSVNLPGDRVGKLPHLDGPIELR